MCGCRKHSMSEMGRGGQGWDVHSWVCMHCLPAYPYLPCLYHTAGGIARPAVPASDQPSPPLQLMLQAQTSSHSFLFPFLFLFLNVWSIYFKSTCSYMVGEIKQQHRKKISCREIWLYPFRRVFLLRVSLHISTLYLKVIHCLILLPTTKLRGVWWDLIVTRELICSANPAMTLPNVFLPFFPSLLLACFSWMLPLKPPYQYSEMISEVRIKSMKSSRDQSARDICRV